MKTNINSEKILPDLLIAKCIDCLNCDRVWIHYFFNNRIICNCGCHRKQVLGRDEHQPNTMNPPSGGETANV